MHKLNMKPVVKIVLYASTTIIITIFFIFQLDAFGFASSSSAFLAQRDLQSKLPTLHSLSLNRYNFLIDNLSLNSAHPTPDPSDPFNLKLAVQEPYDSIFNETLANMISDYNDPGPCVNEEKKVAMRYRQMILEFWVQLADEVEVPYMLAYGTLLGYARNKNQTPYDGDMDIWVPTWAYSRLKPFSSTPPLNLRDDKFLLFLHPEFSYVPGDSQQRVDCKGHHVPAYTGLCSFTTNMGRLAYKGLHLDLFALDYLRDQGIVAIPKNEMIRQSKKDIFFPLRPCTFFGVRMYCPNRYELVLRIFYGQRLSNLLPVRYCHNGTFKSKRENPELHQMKLKEWEDKFGSGAVNDVYNISHIYKTIPSPIFCEKTSPPIDRIRYGWCNYPPNDNKTHL